ncbi:hypothetical protein AAG906_030888 [Vitis piasezkii]
MVEEKNMQIASLINKVEAQVQNMGESSQGLNHLLNVASPLDDAPHAYRTIQVERQMAESASLASLSIQQLQYMITNTIRRRRNILFDFDVPNMLEDLLQKRLLILQRLFSPWDAKLKEKLSHGTLSFMDGSLGYNQIQMVRRMKNLRIRTLKGIYCYKVMPFGLNNADATYQHAMRKSLMTCSIRIRYQLMNLLKCAFGRCQPFNRLMKKDVPFVWDKACHNPFESIKRYLANPPILGALMAGKPLILYIAAQKCSLGALSTRYDGTCADVEFVSQQRQILPYSFVLSERCSNNVAKYQALIIGLQMVIEMKITSLEICGILNW